MAEIFRDKNFPEARDNYWIAQARNQIKDRYGVDVTVNGKAKGLRKFGRNDDLNTATFETIWMLGGHETYATGNTIDTISSSSTGDTQEVKIEGHTLSGNDLTFVVQTATLTGQTKALLTTPLYRANRMYNNGSTDFAGSVYLYEDTAISGGVPTDTTKAHLLATGIRNQSEKAATSLSSVDFWIIDHVYGSVSAKAAGRVEFHVQVREYGKVFRSILNVSTSDNFSMDITPHIVVPPNSDFRIVALASAANMECEAGADGLLAMIT
jgi:hypothetical protein